jgi:hypothetical protein
LIRHRRSFCFAFEHSPQPGVLPYRSKVLAIKGSEPYLPDFEQYQIWNNSKRTNDLPYGDHFALAEAKVLGSLTLSEARHEFAATLSTQEKYLAHYGELGPFPVPLLVHEFSEREIIVAKEVLRKVLSAVAFERIEATLNSGLAILISFFPHCPMRTVGVNAANRRCLERMGIWPDLEHTIGSWARTFMRLLYLDLLPCTPQHRATGACIDHNNTTIFGGFCDLDSVTSFDRVPDDRFFYVSLMEAIVELGRSVASLLGRSTSPGAAAPDSTLNRLSRNFVLRLLNDLVESERRPGIELDPRATSILRPASLRDILNVVESAHERAAVYSPVAAQSSPGSALEQ